MNWSDWESIWKRQEPPIGAGADLGLIKQTFEAKHRKMACTLIARDLVEASAGILVAAFFAYSGWRLGRAGWPIAFAVAIVLGLSGFFIWERIRSRRMRLGPGAPLLAKLEADIAELRHQRRLLFNVAGWYLAPLAAAMAIALVTVLHDVSVKAPPGFLSNLMRNPVAAGFAILYLFVLLPLCFWGVWALNRKAVRKMIEPRIEELEKMRNDVLAPN